MAKNQFAIIDGIKVDSLIKYLEKHKGKTIVVGDDCGLDMWSFLEVWPYSGEKVLRFDTMNFEYLGADEPKDTNAYNDYVNRKELLDAHAKIVDEREEEDD